jgi:signal peptidase I
MSEEKDLKPSLDQLKKELKRENRKKEYRKVLRNTLVVVVVVAALAVLISSFFVTVLKVTGDSMTPTLETGEIVIAQNQSSFEPGDLIAFYYNNKVLVKRVIGSPGDWITIDDDGFVSVNGVQLAEEYVTDRSLDPTDIEFPYQVPENRFFVLGDHRSASIDSRSSVVGCVTREQLIGRVFFRVYPFNVFGGL